MKLTDFTPAGFSTAAVLSIIFGIILIGAPDEVFAKTVKTFRLKHGVSKQYLVPDYTGGRDDKRNVSVEGLYGNQDAFRWYLQGNGKRGQYYFVNLATGLVLTSDGDGNISTWGRLGKYILGDHPNQIWSWKRRGKMEGFPIGDREYLIYNTANKYYVTQHDSGRTPEKHNSTIWGGTREFHYASKHIEGFVWEMEDAGDADVSKLTILKVKCIKPSTGQDDATSVLFNAIEAVAQVGLAAATGGGSLAASAAYTGYKTAGRAGAKAALKQITKKQLLEAAKKSAKKKIRDIPKNIYNQNQREQKKEQAGTAVDTVAGDGAAQAVSDALDFTSLEGIFNKIHGDTPDDLELRINNVSVWPSGGRSHISIKSQETFQPEIIFTFPTDRGFELNLVEYDSASDDDSLGWLVWNKSMGYGLTEDQMVVKDDEGSVYQVTYRVDPCGGCLSRIY